jgi:hypothetical protein
MGKHIFVLSYVNLENDTALYDREFNDMDELKAFVDGQHPDCTSYQVIVTSDRSSDAITQEKFDDLNKRAT